MMLQLSVIIRGESKHSAAIKHTGRVGKKKNNKTSGVEL